MPSQIVMLIAISMNFFWKHSFLKRNNNKLCLTPQTVWCLEMPQTLFRKYLSASCSPLCLWKTQLKFLCLWQKNIWGLGFSPSFAPIFWKQWKLVGGRPLCYLVSYWNASPIVHWKSQWHRICRCGFHCARFWRKIPKIFRTIQMVIQT